jgi:hypothetical protein
MSAKPMKLITVPANGQISIGTKWAGKQIRIAELSDNEIHISAGSFIPDSQKEFFTRESLETLKEFDQWEEQNPASKESARATLNRLKKQRQARGR